MVCEELQTLFLKMNIKFPTKIYLHMTQLLDKFRELPDYRKCKQLKFNVGEIMFMSLLELNNCVITVDALHTQK